MELNVLMIDDHQSIIEGYKAILAYNSGGYILNTTSANNCREAYNILTTQKIHYDLVMVDYIMPPFEAEKLHSGEDLVPLIRKYHPNAKIMMLTSHYQSLLLIRLLKECNPEGLLVKSDFTAEDLVDAFDAVVGGNVYYSSTVAQIKKELENTPKVLDYYNRQIILLLAQGVQTKNLPDHLFLSKSAIDKRKALIKEFFGIEKGSDEDILREARRLGYI